MAVHEWSTTLSWLEKIFRFFEAHFRTKGAQASGAKAQSADEGKTITTLEAYTKDVIQSANASCKNLTAFSPPPSLAQDGFLFPIIVKYQHNLDQIESEIRKYAHTEFDSTYATLLCIRMQYTYQTLKRLTQ